MFIGKSGTGKTVTMGFTLAQMQKVKPTVVAFDKDRGMEVAIRAMGGRYLPLKSGEPAGFNPFQLEPTPANLIFLKQFVKRLASAGGEPAETQRSLGTVYRARQQAPAARASFQRYLELAPSAPDAAMIKSYLEEIGK